MSDGAVALDGMIERLRELGAGGLDAVAREAAPLVMKAARTTAAAGTDPYGKPWRPRKDGSRAIPDAASAVDAVARGPVIVIRARRGAAMQNALADTVGRQIIPDAAKGIPAPIAEAIAEGASRYFKKAMGG